MAMAPGIVGKSPRIGQSGTKTKTEMEAAMLRDLQPGAREHGPRAGFSLIELLVVIGIMAIILAIASPYVPGLLRGNQFDANVNNLTGILDEAREAATANNTYVWVAFTGTATTTTTSGIWVMTFQSQDGTETNINTGSSTSPTWATGLAITGTATPNLVLHSKLLNLPGLQIDPTLAKNPGVVGTVPTTYTTLAGQPTNLAWTVSNMGATGLAATTPFNYAVEFTPNGEAHVPTWSSNIQVGFYPAQGPSTPNNYALVNLSRLTGRATIFRK